MKWALTDIRKFRKGDVYVDSFTGQSKAEVLDVVDNKVRLKVTHFDACTMDWKSEIIDTNQSAYVIEAHFRSALVETPEEEERLLMDTNKAIENYRKTQFGVMRDEEIPRTSRFGMV